jgi:hypothetical protein
MGAARTSPAGSHQPAAHHARSCEPMERGMGPAAVGAERLFWRVGPYGGPPVPIYWVWGPSGGALRLSLRRLARAHWWSGQPVTSCGLRVRAFSSFGSYCQPQVELSKLQPWFLWRPDRCTAQRASLARSGQSKAPIGSDSIRSCKAVSRTPLEFRGEILRQRRNSSTVMRRWALAVCTDQNARLPL